MKKLIAVALLLCVPEMANAMPQSEEGFTFEGAVNIGTGKMQDKNENVLRRTMSSLTGSIMTGWRFSGWGVGPTGEYRILYQNTEKTTVGNQNAKGKWWVVGIGVNKLVDEWLISGALNFWGKYDLDATTLAGKGVAYNRPHGIKIGASRNIDYNVGAGVFATWTRFTENQISDDTFSINTNKLTYWDVSLAVTYSI